MASPSRPGSAAKNGNAYHEEPARTERGGWGERRDPLTRLSWLFCTSGSKRQGVSSERSVGSYDAATGQLYDSANGAVPVTFVHITMYTRKIATFTSCIPARQTTVHFLERSRGHATCVKPHVGEDTY